MNAENNSEEQKRKLAEMDYHSAEDIFNKEEHISLDGDGIPLTNDVQTEEMPFGLDIPGSEDDDNFEQMTNQIPVKDESLHTQDIIDTDLESSI